MNTPGPDGTTITFRELAEIVRETWPGDLSADDREHLRALYIEMAAVSASDPGQGRENFLARLPSAWLERADNGQLVGIAGLTRAPTHHRITASGQTLYGWCAWDCLFMAQILGQPLEIHSMCPVTSAQVTATVTAGGVASLMPETAVLVFARVNADDFAAGLRQAFCAHVRLCADAEAGAAFAAADARRVVISVDEAHALGTVRNQQVFGDVLARDAD